MHTRSLLALVFMLVGCASAPITARPLSSLAAIAALDTATLPPIPDSVPSMLGPVPVVWGDTLRNEEGRLLMGGFRPDIRTIYLSTMLRANRVVAYQVLFHERCHVLMFDVGLRAVIQEPLAGQVCDSFATMQVVDMLLARRKR